MGVAFYKMIPQGEHSHHRWNYSKQTDSIEYGPIHDTPFEKVCSKMYKQFKVLNKKPFGVKADEINDLKALQRLIAQKVEDYKNTHSGLFGWFVLQYRSFKYGVHIDEISDKLTRVITKLTKKDKIPDITNLDTFLRVVLPAHLGMTNSLITAMPRLVVDPRTDVIMLMEYEMSSPDDTPWVADGLVGDFVEVLKRMESQLKAFEQSLVERTDLQAQRLTDLKISLSIELETMHLKNDPVASALHKNIIASIDAIVAKPVALKKVLPADQLEKEITFKIDEIRKTEETFLKSLDESIRFLKRLETGVMGGSLKYSPKYTNFLTDANPSDTKEFKGNLGHCLTLFKDLQQKTKSHCDQLAEMQGKSIQEGKEALAKMYNSEAYVSYSKNVSNCSRYYDLLMEVKSNLEENNAELDSSGSPRYDATRRLILKPILRKDLYQKKNPLDYLSTVIQRLPRHALFGQDLLDLTEPSEPSYSAMINAFIRIKAAAALLNKRLEQKFIA